MQQRRPRLFCDLETFSPVPIKHGSHRYSEEAEVMLFAYAFENGPVNVWDLTTGKPMPADLEHWLQDENVITVWHNGAAFDTVVLKNAMGIDLPLERVHDTMVMAYQHGLPGALAQLCEVFKLDETDAKDKEGKKLIQLFCVPRPKRSREKRATRHTHPAEWARFVSYAGSDIRAMRRIYQKVPKWNCTAKELSLWRMDQRINRHGVKVDLDLARGAIAAVEQEQARLDLETQERTHNEVASARKRDALLRFIASTYGVELKDMRASTLEAWVKNPETEEPLRELLLLRLAATTSSTAKYKTLLNSCSSDGRLRGLLQFCGAARTGRWAGRIWQPQNLPRPTLSQDAIELAILAFKNHYADLVCDDIMQAASSAIRGCIVAPEGKKLVISDLSNIEGRVLTWLSGETWKINAFYAADRGEGADLYKLAYAKAFNSDVDDVTKWQRQIGKVLELSMGFGGGGSALCAMALAYGMDLEEMAAAALPTIPPAMLKDAEGYLDWFEQVRGEKIEIDRTVFLVCECLKRMWRNAHPRIVQFWYDVEKAARSAINGKAKTVNGLIFDRVGGWLRIRLPSGRYLCYPSPCIVVTNKKTNRTGIKYHGVSPYSRKWCQLSTFGGKLVENIVQAVARDVLAENMPEIMASGYEIVLTVHDEVITEAPDTPDFTASRLSSLLASCPTWASGLPLAAAGFETPRYRKD